MEFYAQIHVFGKLHKKRRCRTPRGGGSARRDEAERIAKSLGGALEAYYWCYGETDFMCIMDIPESAKAAKLALTVGASGTFNGKLTPLITVDEMDEICNTDIGEFTLPGQ